MGGGVAGRMVMVVGGIIILAGGAEEVGGVGGVVGYEVGG